ncbi:hypothetical protein SAMN05428972_0776 [Rhodanobacter sp. OK091]|nr:hypothetical protein SAMN05428972_0776 [Rhodanobacter sp. OK091]
MGKIIFLLGAMLTLASGCAMTRARYVNFINDGQDTVVSIEQAQPGTNRWVRTALDGPLAGGYIGQSILSISTERGCLQDIRILFADRKMLTITALDVCRVPILHIGRAWRLGVENS